MNRSAPPPEDIPLRPVARRCLVRGRVQGVYYRASARERARAGGICGYARNLPDGSVEIMACGDEPAVRAFIEWLWIGPSAAKVAAVQVEELQLAEQDLPQGFTTA
jgi:acylphosphatase